MLDIKFVRQNPDAVKENIKKKFQPMRWRSWKRTKRPIRKKYAAA